MNTDTTNGAVEVLNKRPCIEVMLRHVMSDNLDWTWISCQYYHY